MNKIFNFTIALAKHMANGCKNVSENTALERITICNKCEYRDGKICSICKCNLEEKVWWQTNSCPIDKWKENYDN